MAGELVFISSCFPSRGRRVPVCTVSLVSGDDVFSGEKSVQVVRVLEVVSPNLITPWSRSPLLYLPAYVLILECRYMGQRGVILTSLSHKIEPPRFAQTSCSKRDQKKRIEVLASYVGYCEPCIW